MENWKIILSMPRNDARLLVTCSSGDILKARLPLPARHPRAAVTLLEGLALWAGNPVSAVISVGRTCHRRSAAAVFGPDEWPTESPLVTWVVADDERQVRIPGVADFRGLYAARGRS